MLCLLVAASMVQCKKTDDPAPVTPAPTPTPTPVAPTDPLTGAPVTNLTSTTGDCYISNIAQRNNNYSTNIDNALVISRDTAFQPTRLVYVDSLTNKNGSNITVNKINDSIALSTGEYFLLDKTSKQVVFFSSKADLTDPLSDNMQYRYIYNAAGYLIQKFIYFNSAALPTYETDYSYSSDNTLTGCVLYFGAKKLKFLESTIQVDLTTSIKSWIYLFPDFFEGYNYLQAFNFGKKNNYPLKSIVTNVYDINDGTVYDTWNTSFTSTVVSKDNYLLQITANGDQQQGLGFLFGVTRFSYQCTK
jgi:hypothetical protein